MEGSEEGPTSYGAEGLRGEVKEALFLFICAQRPRRGDCMASPRCCLSVGNAARLAACDLLASELRLAC